MSYIPKDHIEKFYKSNDKYRKYFISKVHQYLLIDFTVLSIILALSFEGLTVFSRIITIILFLCAFSTKFKIIIKKLKEFTVPIDEYWDRYDIIKEKAENGYKDQKEKNNFIERELDETYYATLKKATEDTHKYYPEAMHKLNRYITFSFFNIFIVLLNIGFIDFFSWNLFCKILVFPFDIAIILILVYGLIVGFDKSSAVKEFFKKLCNPVIWIKKK